MGRDKINISILTSGDFPDGGSGENLIRNLAMGMKEHSADIEVIRYRGIRSFSINNSGIIAKNYLFKKNAKNDLLKIFYQICLIAFVPLFLIHHKFKRRGCPLLIFGLKYAYELFPFLLWCKILNIKIYQIIADYYPKKMIVPVWWKSFKNFFYRIQRKHIDKHFDGIIVLSHQLQQECLKYKVAKRKIIIIPHFICFNETNFVHKSCNLRKITYSGGISVDNGITDLIEAFQLLKKKHDNIELVIIGNITKAFKKELEVIKELTVNVKFTGFLPNKEAIEIMKKSHVLVNPRRISKWSNAGFPTKIGEYFSTKKVVVSTPVGDLPHYLTNEKEIIFAENNNPQSLASAINFLLHNNNLAEKIAKNAYLWGKKHLDYNKNAYKTLQFIFPEKTIA
jgi:glycosyltransferase involved in cell wall biosynthesis